MFWAFNIGAQNIIISVAPANVCPTLCATVYFKYNNTCKLPSQQSPAFPVQPMMVSIGDTIIIKPYSSFYSNPKTVNFQSDTIYSMPVCYSKLGTYTLSAYGYCSTAFLGGNAKYTINVIDCAIVGIPELEIDNNYKYYDFNGIEVLPETGRLLIRKGRDGIKKVIIW